MNELTTMNPEYVTLPLYRLSPESPAKRPRFIALDGTEPVCANCAHYYQHYTFNRDMNRYHPVYAGHCGTPRTKDRAPCTEACHRFRLREIKEEV